MIQWLEKSAQRLTASRVLFFLSALIVAHLLVMLSFMHNTQIAHRDALRHSTIQKIVNVIHLIEATPALDRTNALHANIDPILIDSISAKPIWPVQLQKLSWWDINKTLIKQQKDFAISIKLPSNQWLNLKATSQNDMLSTQMILLGVETFTVGLLFLAAMMVKRYTRPLEHFKAAAMAVRNASSDFPDKIDGPAVVKEVLDAVNTMRVRIAQQAEDRTRMLAAISHDLRTPITRMTLRAELLTDQNTKNALMKDLSEMKQMVNETLAFARADGASATSSKIDLVSMVESICHDQQDMGFPVTFISTHKRISYEGKALALKRAFTNLVANACCYGDHVAVSLSEAATAINLLIQDDGPGLPEDELETVFKPFYRSDRSRSRDSGGIGLGLAVARDFISLHGGAVSLSNKNNGLLATVTLPIM